MPSMGFPWTGPWLARASESARARQLSGSQEKQGFGGASLLSSSGPQGNWSFENMTVSGGCGDKVWVALFPTLSDRHRAEECPEV